MSSSKLTAAVVMAGACAAAVALAVIVVARARTDTEQIRRAIVRDAGFTPDQSRVLMSTIGSVDRAPGMFINLTDYLLFERAQETPATFWLPDVQHTGSGSPSDLVEFLSRGECVSMLQIEDITSFDCWFAGEDNAWGTLTCGCEGVWRGRLDFKAERRGGNWVATAFRLPADGRELRLMDNGLWMACPLERRAAYADSVGVLVDSRGVISLMRRVHSPAELSAALHVRARVSPKDAEGLPTVGIRLTVDPFTQFGHVHAVIAACRDAQIRRVRWSLCGDDLDLLLRVPAPEAGARAEPGGAQVVRIAWDRTPVRALVADEEGGRVTVGPGVVVDDPDGVLRDPHAYLPDARDRVPREVCVESGADVPFQWVFGAARDCVASGVERFDFRITQ